MPPRYRRGREARTRSTAEKKPAVPEGEAGSGPRAVGEVRGATPARRDTAAAASPSMAGSSPCNPDPGLTRPCSPNINPHPRCSPDANTPPRWLAASRSLAASRWLAASIRADSRVTLRRNPRVDETNNRPTTSSEAARADAADMAPAPGSGGGGTAAVGADEQCEDRNGNLLGRVSQKQKGQGVLGPSPAGAAVRLRLEHRLQFTQRRQAVVQVAAEGREIAPGRPHLG
eukprot:scaffold342_cov106-Isochrysis_galbana.AAC.5